MRALKVGEPNRVSKKDQIIYLFYPKGKSGSDYIGRAIYNPMIWKTQLSLQVKHPNNSPFYRSWKENYQGAGKSTLSRTNALKEFKKWYSFLTPYKKK